MLRRWPVILLLAAIGLACLGYVIRMPPTPVGVTPQGDVETAVSRIAAIAGAITTLGTAIFGLLGKWTEHRKARLDIEKAKLDIEERRRALDG